MTEFILIAVLMLCAYAFGFSHGVTRTEKALGVVTGKDAEKLK